QQMLDGLLLSNNNLGQLLFDALAALTDLIDKLLLCFIGVYLTSHQKCPSQVASVGHGVGHDIDSHRIGFFFGELTEIPLTASLAFPTVAKVRVMADDHHHSPLVIEDRPIVRISCIRTFPRDSGSAIPHRELDG